MKTILFTFFLTNILSAQVGIGNEKPNAALDIVSENHGVLMPKISDEINISTNEESTIFYSLNDQCLKFREFNKSSSELIWSCFLTD